MTKTIEKTPAPTGVSNQPTQIIPRQNGVVETESEYDIKAYIAKRTDFIKNVNTICIEGKDYHVIQGKKSLAKGGAEKIASIFKWTAKFDKDTEAIEMLGAVPGLVAFKCTLMNGHFVGEGRGAATMAKNGGDPNKTLKMAQKSAFIDAVLRASGLSDFFTQDLEDMPANTVTTHQQEKPAVKGYHNLYFCSEHDQTIGLVPAGVSKRTGKPYKAFYACSVRGCKNPIVNGDGVRVRQHPETGEMVPDQVQEAEIVEESAADKARRILNEKIPLNQGQQVKFDK